MFWRKITYYLGLILLLVLNSCTYQKQYTAVLKSGTPEEKYLFANAAYDKSEYKKAIPIYEELLPIYRGRDQAEGLLYNLANGYFMEKDYFMSAYYYKMLNRQFPNSKYVQEAAFMSAYCKTLESPFYKLDQTATYEAIRDLSLFINYYPNHPKVEEANSLIAQMRDKLAQKAFAIANMYYKRELFNASAIAYKNFVKDYPESPLREDALYFLVKSRYLYAENSIKVKQLERYEKVLEAHALFMRSYSNSKHTKELDKIYQQTVTKTN
ncbi:MAG: outer membrane protein assembly factor BamD [Bacteroidales bacterium]